MSIRLFNTLSEKKEIIKPANRKRLRLFVCGPTVYDYAHIGHARTSIFFDFLVKYLRSQKLNVFYLQNITNIDDKIIKRAREEKKNPFRLADFFTKEYLKDMKALGVNAINAYAPATKFIPQIIRQVKKLIKKGYAYKIENDGYYFDISRFSDYGKLSKRTAKQAEDSVSRIDESVKKRNRGDFCLWKLPSADTRGLNADIRRKKFAVVNGEPLWNTKLGWGRPGWHIEDTAISEHYFGPQYDIHGGGLDLKFPHHEAEIAQQEAASGKKPFVKIWVHAGILYVDGKKMSKSLGNFILIRSILKTHSPESIRFFFLSHHYRSPVDFTETQIKDAEKTLEGVALFLGKLDFLLDGKQSSAKSIELSAKGGSASGGKKYSEMFSGALADDINTPDALAAIFELINDTNKIVWQLNHSSARKTKEFIEKSLSLFGISFPLPRVPSTIRRFAAEREKFRRNKQFIQSDALRKKISSLGYVIEDTPVGPFIWRDANPKNL